MRIHCKLNKQVFARDPCFDMLTYYPLQSIIKIPTKSFIKIQLSHFKNYFGIV